MCYRHARTQHGTQCFTTDAGNTVNYFISSIKCHGRQRAAYMKEIIARTMHEQRKAVKRVKRLKPVYIKKRIIALECMAAAER